MISTTETKLYAGDQSHYFAKITIELSQLADDECQKMAESCYQTLVEKNGAMLSQFETDVMAKMALKKRLGGIGNIGEVGRN